MPNENVNPVFKGILNSVSQPTQEAQDNDPEPQYRDYVPGYLDGFNKKNKEEEYETALAEWQERQKSKDVQKYLIYIQELLTEEEDFTIDKAIEAIQANKQKIMGCLEREMSAEEAVDLIIRGR